MYDKEKILNAAPIELTIINHELLIQNIDKALKASPKSGALTAALKKSRDTLAVLYETLNMNVNLSQDLATLYLFINSILIKTAFINDNDEKDEALTCAKRITQELLEAWQTVHQSPHPQRPIGEIFAGLTYDKHGNLSEYNEQDYNPNSGYKI